MVPAFLLAVVSEERGNSVHVLRNKYLVETGW